jgi:hypothetical protein
MGGSYELSIKQIHPGLSGNRRRPLIMSAFGDTVHVQNRIRDAGATARTSRLISMKSLAPRIAPLLVVAAALGCSAPEREAPAFAADSELLHGAVQELTDVMIGSVTSPPVASRTYAYASVAAYEAIRHQSREFRSLAGQLNGLESVPRPREGEEYLLELSSVYAFLSVAEKIVFEPQRIVERRDSIVAAAGSGGIPEAVVERSVAYGDEVARHILAWAGSDGIKKARAMSRYSVTNQPGRWRPTPPGYIQGVEANWGVLRPFTMESASEFRPATPIAFDMREGSAFRAEVDEVVRVSRSLTPEQREIAAFWDCNPFALKVEGHFTYAVKKITPPGHWMGITAIATRQVGADLVRTAEAYAYVGIASADAFISTWDEKYRSNLVRPETIINDAIDPGWRPVLQTPPFPEYPSGHSVLSTAVAEVLSDLFGDEFSYSDTTEVPYGLPVRSFTSFRQAAEEAAISRLYGGIHYPMGIEHGVTQGRELGKTIVARLRTRTAESLAMR